VDRLKNVLITGANGFLGSHVLEELVANNYSPILLVRPTSDLWRIKKFLPLCSLFEIQEDGKNLPALFENFKINCIVHTATEYGKDNTLTNLLKTNIILPIELVELGIEFGVEVFINTDTFFAKEQFHQSYLNQYTQSKRILQSLLFDLSDRIKIINVRLEHLFGENDTDQKFVTLIFNKLLANAPEVLLTEGNQKRDFVYVRDVANAYLKIIDQSFAIEKYKEFEVGTGKSISVRAFVERMASILSANTDLKFGALPTRKGDIEDSFASIDELLKIGWSPAYSLDDAINNMIIKEKDRLKK